MRTVLAAISVSCWMVLAVACLPSASSVADTPADPSALHRDIHYDYFVSGDPTLPRATQTRFMLALLGGGGSVDAAFAAIARAAGGGHIVVLSAVADDRHDPSYGAYGNLFVTRWGPVASAETIVFHDRDASYDARVLAILGGADGIFITGGDQSNYLRYWKGTPVQDALNHHVQANRPLGGASAGLAILGHYSYTALDGGSLESRAALADPAASAVTLESNFLHLHWLDDVITDSHFSARSRLGRLLVFLARVQEERGDQKALGLGIDEKTALLIGPDGIGRLAEGSAGSAWLVTEPRPAALLTHGRPLSVSGIRIVRLGSRSLLDLTSGVAQMPAATATMSIGAGVVSADPILRHILSRDAVPAGEP
jgi:beta-aspartyl-peptidase (threonine type)